MIVSPPKVEQDVDVVVKGVNTGVRLPSGPPIRSRTPHETVLIVKVSEFVG
jgi:hypothetical protein